MASIRFPARTSDKANYGRRRPRLEVSMNSHSRQRNARVFGLALVALLGMGDLLTSCSATSSYASPPASGRSSQGSGEALVPAGSLPPASFQGAVVPASSVAPTAVSLIDGVPARGFVDLEVYELGNPSVISALESAKRRGVVVRIILDATERESKVSGPELHSNGLAVEMMRVPGGIDHVKLLIAGSTVLMGGVNLGTGSSYTTDMDVELPSSYLQNALSIFNTDWLAAGVDASPANGQYGPFVTGSAIEPAVLGVVDAASTRSRCYVAANYLSDWTIREALVQAARRGVAVSVLLNPTAYGEGAAASALRAGGAQVEVAPPSPYLHAKLLACKTTSGAWSGVVGSANFSYDGMKVNHELDLVVSGELAGEVGRWVRQAVG